MPLRQLVPDPGQDDAKIDIIAIHGLNPRNKSHNQHAFDTWRSPSGQEGRLWLKEDLPRHVPESRIFLYQYNAKAVYGQDLATFSDKANELLEAISIEREEDPQRPIIMLGHSLGGLLIKQALINAHNNPDYASIKDATTGLAFFGTPHNGGDSTLVSLGEVATKIAGALGFRTGDDIIEVLKNGSIFSELMKEHWRHQLLAYNIVSFWGQSDAIVSSASARFGMPGDREKIVGLNADHGAMCRFGSTQTDEDNLKLVAANIKRLYQKGLEKCRSQNDVLLPQVPDTELPPRLENPDPKHADIEARFKFLRN